MTHEEHDTCGCGCGHDHHHHAHCGETPTANQVAFLHQLGHSRYLPVARFLVTDSGAAEYSAVALAPVFLRSAGDDMAAVKESGAFLQKLEDMGLVTLDYDIPLAGYGYEEYHAGTLYTYFCQTVQEAAGRPGFLGDTPKQELGSMALTAEGELVAKAGHGGCGCGAS